MCVWDQEAPRPAFTVWLIILITYVYDSLAFNSKSPLVQKYKASLKVMHIHYYMHTHTNARMHIYPLICVRT